jgi:hypothetical protein
MYFKAQSLTDDDDDDDSLLRIVQFFVEPYA